MALGTVTKPSCSSINIANGGDEATVSYLLEVFSPTTLAWTAVDGGSGNLTTGQDVDIDLEDGIYRVTVGGVAPDEIYVETKYYYLETCYVKLFTKVACSTINRNCCETCESNKIDLAMFNLLLQVYFSIQRKYNSFLSPFTTLDSDTVADLVQLSKVVENLEKYCTDCESCDCN